MEASHSPQTKTDTLKQYGHFNATTTKGIHKHQSDECRSPSGRWRYDSRVVIHTENGYQQVKTDTSRSERIIQTERQTSLWLIRHIKSRSVSGIAGYPENFGILYRLVTFVWFDKLIFRMVLCLYCREGNKVVNDSKTGSRLWYRTDPERVARFPVLSKHTVQKKWTWHQFFLHCMQKCSIRLLLF